MLASVVEHLLSRYPLVVARSFSQVLENERFGAAEDHELFYLERAEQSGPLESSRSSFWLILNELEDFERYFDSCLSFCAGQE